MDVRFVGHPLIDLVQPTETRDAFLGRLNLDRTAPVVALLPGSRANELSRLAPVLAQAATLIAAKVPRAQFVVARAPHLSDHLFEAFGIPSLTLRIVEGRTDDVLQACDEVLTASGTATVQAALHGKPMAVLYKLSPMTYRLGKPLARVDMYAMVNLIAGRPVVMELIQDACTPEAVAAEAVRILTDEAYRANMTDELSTVRARLGARGASARAAAAVLDVIHSNHAS
jgi:lipid-A-disaccharide synthase